MLQRAGTSKQCRTKLVHSQPLALAEMNVHQPITSLKLI